MLDVFLVGYLVCSLHKANTLLTAALFVQRKNAPSKNI